MPLERALEFRPTGQPALWDALAIWIPAVANGLTIVAGVIAIGTLFSAWLSRPKLEVAMQLGPPMSPDWSAQIHLYSTGSSPVKHIRVHSGIIDRSGRDLGGGSVLAFPELQRFQAASIHAFTRGAVQFSDSPGNTELRLPFPPDSSCWIAIQHDRPIQRWKTRTIAYFWSREARSGLAAPEEHTGRKAERYLNQRLKAGAEDRPRNV